MRLRVEWLLLPLLVLPLLLALGVHLWASAAHERDLDAYRVRGHEQFVRLTSDPTALPDLRDPSRRPGVTATIGTTRIRVVVQGLDAGTWNFAPDFPEGISAAALADDEMRMKLQTGTRPVSLPGVDEATRGLHGLLQERSLPALRIAQLPAATKRYVLERWIRDEDTPTLRMALRLVTAIERLGERLPLPPGHHPLRGANHVTVADGRTTVFLRGMAWRRSPMADPAHPDVRLWFGAYPHEPKSGEVVLWEQRREAPLAGMWAFVYSGTLHWWEAAGYQTYVGPGIALFLLLLAIPVALWFALRRRRKLDEARTRFINELAHDLRTPLTSLRLHAEMLGSGRTPEDRRPHYLGLIERESSRLSALLGNLLDLSRLDGARAALHPQALPVATAVEQAAQAFVAVHPERADDVSLAGDEGVTVHADAAALARVLGNLLENAGKFTPAGTEIRIHWAAEDTHVRLSVSDDGPGIPTEEQRTLFDRYTRGARAKRDGVAGSGLGLALVKELTTRMEGSVRLQPSRRGATFRIRLPKGHDA